MLIPVVLAGGVGSRLWPVSRSMLPKQFIDFPNLHGSLFQNTLTRLDGLNDISEPLVVCNADHRFLVAEQLRALQKIDNTILLEPIGRNTAPAVAMAALSAQQNYADPVLLVLPADHLIQNKVALHKAIEKGMRLAQNNQLVTFGIVPDAPETGFGYIERGEELAEELGEKSAYKVSRFIEKPDRSTAESYLADGRYLWNSGMFMFTAANYLQELKRHAPDIFASCHEAYAALEREQDFQFIPQALFANCRSDSIDYAVMEKTKSAAVIPLDAGWSDLGAWDALWQVDKKDVRGNAISGDVITENVANSYIQAQSRLVAVAGIENAIIVETADAVLVMDKSKAQSVKQLVEQLQARNRDESVNHRLVYRPWGSYESLVIRPGYQLKHIIVNPGACLSLQMHKQRSEHWTAIKGVSLVTCDDREFELKPDESTYIPLGSKHRLSNNGSAPIEIIEIQIGDYLGEDDIVRFEDKYDRV